MRDLTYRMFAAALLFAQPFPGAGSSGGTMPVSPSVLATDMCVMDETGRGTLELLVLWRGSPLWFRRSAGGASGSGGGGTHAPGSSMMRSEWISQGGVSLSVRFDPAARKAWIQEKEIELGDANVLLVDDVDSPAGPRVVSLVRIDGDYKADVTRPAPIHTFIRRSSDLVEFLRCDTRVPDASAYEQQVFETWCSLVKQP
jgi:hypothetical protein